MGFEIIVGFSVKVFGRIRHLRMPGCRFNFLTNYPKARVLKFVRGCSAVFISVYRDHAAVNALRSHYVLNNRGAGAVLKVKNDGLEAVGSAEGSEGCDISVADGDVDFVGVDCHRFSF